MDMLRTFKPRNSFDLGNGFVSSINFFNEIEIVTVLVGIKFMSRNFSNNPILFWKGIFDNLFNLLG